MGPKFETITLQGLGYCSNIYRCVCWLKMKYWTFLFHFSTCLILYSNRFYSDCLIVFSGFVSLVAIISCWLIILEFYITIQLGSIWIWWYLAQLRQNSYPIRQRITITSFIETICINCSTIKKTCRVTSIKTELLPHTITTLIEIICIDCLMIKKNVEIDTHYSFFLIKIYSLKGLRLCSQFSHYFLFFFTFFDFPKVFYKVVIHLFPLPHAHKEELSVHVEKWTFL